MFDDIKKQVFAFFKRFSSIFLPTTVGVFLLSRVVTESYVAKDLRYFFEGSNGFVNMFSFILFLVLLIGPIMYKYLQVKSSSQSKNILDKDLRERILMLETYLSEQTADNYSHYAKIPNTIHEYLSEYIEKIANEDFLKAIDNKYSREIIGKYKFDKISMELHSINRRLAMESIQVYRTSNLNLILGMSTTVFAIGFLVFTLLTNNHDVYNVANTKLLLSIYILKLLPRLFVSIFIEVFAFFFLKMYKKNIDDIKYISNERTNVELKLLALNTSALQDDPETLNQILLELSKTERNYILRKGETTVEVEREKMKATNYYKDTLDGLSRVIQKNK